MQIDRKHMLKTYNNYINGFKPFGKCENLKVTHVVNVVKNCQSIAKKHCPKNIDLAWLIGLLHDIGRFEQLRQYHTFNDNKSLDHAQLGNKILFEDGLIDKFFDSKKYYEEAHIIKNAIFFHNKLKIDLSKLSKDYIYCQIIRDADKIDIFRSCACESEEAAFGGTKQELENSILSDSVYEACFKKSAISYSLRESLVDDLVCHLAFIFDFNFEESVKIAKNDGYFLQMQQYTFSDKTTQKRFEEICKLFNS